VANGGIDGLRDLRPALSARIHHAKRNDCKQEGSAKQLQRHWQSPDRVRHGKVESTKNELLARMGEGLEDQPEQLLLIRPY
jgi:hypothetical protein